jgi:hypothetical protein
MGPLLLERGLGRLAKKNIVKYLSLRLRLSNKKKERKVSRITDRDVIAFEREASYLRMLRICGKFVNINSKIIFVIKFLNFL